MDCAEGKFIHIDYFCLIFFLVIFSNFGIGSLLLSDIIYTVVAIVALLQTKGFKKNRKIYGYVLFFGLLTFLGFLRFQHTKAFLSCFRFFFGISVCSLLFSSYNNTKYRNRVISGYYNACVIFSIFLLIQFFSYYVLHYNIGFSFGEFAREENVAGEYNPLDALLYRTGGFFKEPSWYAAFVVPSLFILTERKEYIKLVLCICGLIASTSGLGFGLLAIYMAWMTVSYNKKLGIILMLFMLGVYFLLPFVFEKIGIGENSSFSIRVQEPFDELRNLPFSIIGLNPDYHYDKTGDSLIWLNTFMFSYFYFGIFGLFVFVKFLYCKKIQFLSLTLLTIIVMEGLYGRIEFWMMLCACKLFNEEITYYSKRKIIEAGH